MPYVRVTRVEGDGASVSAGANLEAGALLQSGDAKVVLDFHDGGRLEILPHSSARLGQAEPQEMMLAHGMARAVLPAAGNSPRPSIRLATAAGVVELPGAGAVLVAALPGGHAWVACGAGSVSVRDGEVDEEGRPRTSMLVAGQAVALTPALGPATAAPSDAAGAQAMAQGLLEHAAPETAPEVRARSEQGQVDLLAALVALETLYADGEALRARQRSLARSDPPAARALLPQLVEHSRARLRARERLLVRYERATSIDLELGQPNALEARVVAALSRGRVASQP